MVAEASPPPQLPLPRAKARVLALWWAPETALRLRPRPYPPHRAEVVCRRPPSNATPAPNPALSASIEAGTARGDQSWEGGRGGVSWVARKAAGPNVCAAIVGAAARAACRGCAAPHREPTVCPQPQPQPLLPLLRSGPRPPMCLLAIWTACTGRASQIWRGICARQRPLSPARGWSARWVRRAAGQGAAIFRISEPRSEQRPALRAPHARPTPGTARARARHARSRLRAAHSRSAHR